MNGLNQSNLLMFRVFKKVLSGSRLAKVKLFVLIGLVAVFIDYLFYIVLINLGFNIILSKAVGFLFGTNFSFYFNKTFTFRSNFTHIKLFKYLLLYVFTMNLNIQINAYFFKFLNDFQFATQIAFFIATGVCAAINFLGLNYFIFYQNKFKTNDD